MLKSDVEIKADETREKYKKKFNESFPPREIPDMSYEEEFVFIEKCIAENKTAFFYYPPDPDVIY